jgi:trans-2,3-dihydro-3-hydroxyanthranilate isomerase
MTSNRTYAVLDAFTDTPLQGNPVAVFLDGTGLDTDTMQRAARELNLSETVFLLPPDDPAAADARARIFTPAAELPFAGHPVLGTAFLLAAERAQDRIRLQTGAGIISIILSNGYGEMEQPTPRVEPFTEAGELLSSLGVERAELPVEMYVNGPRHVMVMLDSVETVAALSPDLNALGKLEGVGVSCFCLTGAGKVRTRMFAPALGVPEDPATGSAAGPLAIHLLRHGRTASGEQLTIHQGTEIGRPSVIYARVFGSPQRIDRVMVGGGAVEVARGQYRLA